jgi:glycosyltransferase involved in cell wall biosynthesis
MIDYKQSMKILILLLYYERPEMVRNALNSIRDLEYDDWHLAFIDDGSRKPGRPLVEEILKDHLSRVTFYNTGHTPEDKNRQGGSVVGAVMNKAVGESDAEMAIMLCDDDALLPTYFSNLKKWATTYPDRHYCYSHVILYDPFKEKPHQDLSSVLLRKIDPLTHKFNRRKNWFNKTTQMYPEAKLDASQVAWRTYCNDKAHFESPRTCHLDSAFYKQLGEFYGQILFSGFYGQYKGMHDNTLSIRDEASRNTKGKINKWYTVEDLNSKKNP